MNIDSIEGHDVDWSKNTNNYFYVYNRSQNGPKHRHLSLQEALKEAARLSEKENKNFYVLQPIAKVCRKEKQLFTERFTDLDQEMRVYNDK